MLWTGFFTVVLFPMEVGPEIAALDAARMTNEQRLKIRGAFITIRELLCSQF